MSRRKTEIFLIFLWFCFVADTNAKPLQNHKSEAGAVVRDPKEFNINLKNNNKPENSQNGIPMPEESLILGPLEVRGIHNSSLKNFRLAPGLAKEFRNEVFRRNQLLGRNLSTRKTDEGQQKRIARSAIGPLAATLSKRQGLGLATALTPQQQQQLLLIQQQQQAAAFMQQQQMMSLQSQGQLYNGLNRRRQRPSFYDDYDDDDSDSDEDDEFDSDEFMSFPIQMGFMPPPPGYPGYNGRDYTN